MELDTAFLRELNVLDYSLLMAFQHLHEDERGLGSSLVFRTARWAPHRANSKNEVMRAWERQMVRWGTKKQRLEDWKMQHVCIQWRAGEAWLARIEGPGGPQQGREQVTSNWTRASA